MTVNEDVGDNIVAKNDLIKILAMNTFLFCKIFKLISKLFINQSAEYA